VEAWATFGYASDTAVPDSLSSISVGFLRVRDSNPTIAENLAAFLLDVRAQCDLGLGTQIELPWFGRSQCQQECRSQPNVKTVRDELGLAGISTAPNSLIVIGRSHMLTEETRRALVTTNNTSPKIRILTYDDVYDRAKAVIENLLGPIWDQPGGTKVYYVKDRQQIAEVMGAKPNPKA
jgi:hypothetical protein